MSFIQLNGVTFQYGTQSNDDYAVKDVNFKIDQGQFTGITGPSEAGKSTFCRLISGQIPHFYNGELSGTVTIEGTSTVESTAGNLSEKIGFVFENPHDQLTGATSTVLEEVAFGLETRGLTRDEMRDRAKESLRLVGIEDLADRNPMQLSGGQCQRVAIASVIAMKPEVLILQQPTAQLDPEGTEEVFDVVGTMNEEGYTVVIVSQELDQLIPRLDTLVVMDEGQVKFSGSPGSTLINAMNAGLPVSIPTPVEIGHRLREVGFVSDDTPVPVTESDCLTELRRLTMPSSSNGSRVHSHDTEPTNATLEKHSEIVMEDVHHRYPSDVKALDGISLSLDEGCICLIGQNGAGKSTLVKHLNSLLAPTEGSIHVRDMDTRKHSTAELAHEVGLSFQNADDQLFHNTVQKEIEYGPRNLGFDQEEITESTELSLNLLGLEQRRDQNPYDFSQPLRKRVAMASVVAMDTPIIVLDEPTGGQDVPGGKQLGEAIQTLVEEGKLVIVITHDMDFVRKHADRTVLLSEGQVIADGDTRDILSDSETLSRSNVHPPTITRIGLELGIGPILSVDELFDKLSQETDTTV